ncbi:MAG: hypothetical protein GY679_01310 [Mycoplasma sp.]|nr:hypothetical protein [Mycoplasma sp.]
MALINRLIGNDGYLSVAEIGSDLVGDGIDDLDDLYGGGVGSGARFYQVVQIADATSAITALSADLRVGDYFYNDGLTVLSAGTLLTDVVKSLPGAFDAEKDTSIKSFEITLSKDKIDTTTLTDDLKTYRMGRGDAAGSITGVTEVDRDLFSDRFLTRIEQAPDGTGMAVTRATNLPIYFVGFLQGQFLSGETVSAIVGKVELEGFTYGAADGSAQEFTTGFAPTAGDTLQKININIP